MAASQRFRKLCLRDRDGIGTQMYGSGTVAGPILSGAGAGELLVGMGGSGMA